MQLFSGSEWTGKVFDCLQPDLQTPVDCLVFITGDLKRVDLFHQIRICVDDLFQICRVHLGAVKRHGQIATTIDEQNRKSALQFRELRNIYVLRRKLFSKLCVRNDAAEIVQVITQFWRGTRLSADTEDQLSLRRGLDDVVKRVVLKNHRRHFASEKCL